MVPRGVGATRTYVAGVGVTGGPVTVVVEPRGPSDGREQQHRKSAQVLRCLVESSVILYRCVFIIIINKLLYVSRWTLAR